MDAVEAWTDGACSGNPGPGGWAWVVPGGGYASGAEAQSTNQRMEILAAYEAVRANPGDLEIVSDSTYVVNCFNDRWWEGWIARGWKNKAKKPVANQDLWKPFIDLVRERGDVSFRWVKGHSDNKWNDVADRLAVEAAETQQGRSGQGEPTDLGAADAPRKKASNAASTGAPASVDTKGGLDSRRPAGHLVGIFGHRPPELGGYDEGLFAADLKRRIGEILSAKAAIESDLLAVSGLNLGAEMLGAEAAIDAGIPLLVIQPFPGFSSRWPPSSQERYLGLVAAATKVVQLEKVVPDGPQKFGAAMARRDGWLAKNLDEAILVWDEQNAAYRALFKKLESALDADVWIVRPDG